MVTGGQRQGGYGSHAVGVCPQGQQPAESILGTLVGRLLALGTATPAPMDILVSPWVAQRICPVGTHVLLEYGVSCAEAAWPPSVVGMAQGPSPLFSTLALLVMLCNFQWRYSRVPSWPCRQPRACLGPGLPQT